MKDFNNLLKSKSFFDENIKAYRLIEEVYKNAYRHARTAEENYVTLKKFVDESHSANEAEQMAQTYQQLEALGEMIKSEYNVLDLMLLNHSLIYSAGKIQKDARERISRHTERFLHILTKYCASTGSDDDAEFKLKVRDKTYLYLQIGRIAEIYFEAARKAHPIFEELEKNDH